MRPDSARCRPRFDSRDQNRQVMARMATEAPRLNPMTSHCLASRRCRRRCEEHYSAAVSGRRDRRPRRHIMPDEVGGPQRVPAALRDDDQGSRAQKSLSDRNARSTRRPPRNCLTHPACAAGHPQRYGCMRPSTCRSGVQESSRRPHWRAVPDHLRPERVGAAWLQASAESVGGRPSPSPIVDCRGGAEADAIDGCSR